MLDATWTLRPCEPRQTAALAAELGVTETTASVLIRRGYDARAGRCVPRRRDAGARSLPARRHARGLRTDPRGDRRRERICVHGDYDVDGICATALAVLMLRELGADVDWHLPSRFEEGYGIAARRCAARGRGLRPRPHRRLRDHRGRRGRRGARGRARRDRHRPPPPRRRAARLPDRGHAAVRLPVPGALRHGVSSTSSRKRCSAPATEAPDARTSTWSPWPRSPTSCRWSTRTARSRSPVSAAWRRRNGRACAR